MITIYANWTGNALASGTTLDEARAKLTSLDCVRETTFGDGPADVTALDTGPHPIEHTGDRFAYLRYAREAFALVSAEGAARI